MTKPRRKKETPTDTELSKYVPVAIRFFVTGETHMEELREYYRSAEKEPGIAKIPRSTCWQRAVPTCLARLMTLR